MANRKRTSKIIVIILMQCNDNFIATMFIAFIHMLLMKFYFCIVANTTKYNLGGTRKEKTMMKEIIEKIRTSLDPSVTRPSVMAPTYST